MDRVFEVGTRVRMHGWRPWGYTGDSDMIAIVDEMKDRSVWLRAPADVWDESRLGRPALDEDWFRGLAKILAPAPKPGQRWESATNEPVQIVGFDDGTGDIAVEPVDPRDIIASEWCSGPVYLVARWLLDNGYKPASAGAPATVRSAPDGDLRNATILNSEGTLGHIWRTGDKCEITWVAAHDRTYKTWENVATVRERIADGTWTRIEVPAKEASTCTRWPGQAPSTIAKHVAMLQEKDYTRVAREIADQNIGRTICPPDHAPMTFTLPQADASATYEVSFDGKTWIDAPPDGRVIAAVGDRISFRTKNAIPQNVTYRYVATADRYPNLRAARPFFDLLAAIYTTPTREQSRRYVDMAVAAIKGEPFWRAIQAVLVAASPEKHSPLTPAEVAGYINGCRAWERRRGEVAPGQRELKRWQIIECSAAASASGPMTRTSKPFLVYERARSL